MTQMLSFWTSVVFLLVSIALILVSKPNARWVWVVFSMSWLGGVFYYSGLLFLNIQLDWHSLSSVLRTYQNFMFGTLSVFILYEKLRDDEQCNKIFKRIKRTWKMKFLQLLSHLW